MADQLNGARLLRCIAFLALWCWGTGAWAQTAIASLGLTAEEQTWLASRRDGIIRVAITEVAPLVIRDAQAGTYQGIALDYLRLAEARLGVRFKIEYYETWADVLEAGRQRRADMLLTAVRTPEREAFLRFPTPYVAMRNVIISRRGEARGPLTLADLAGRRVAVLDQSAAHERLRKEYPELLLQPHRDERSVILAVAFAEADAAVVELARTTWAIEKEGLTNLVTAGETPIVYALSMAVRDDYALLAGILDKVSRSFTPAEHARIDARWIHLNTADLLGDRRIWAAAGAAVLVLLAIFGWNLTLRRQVVERTQVLSRQIGELERLEKELRDQAQLHRDIAELNSDWFWEQDENLRFTHLWGGGWARANFDLARSVGKTRWELDVRGVSEDEWVEHKAQLAAHETFRNFIVEIRDGVGNWHWVSVSGQPVFDENGVFTGYRGAASDITQRLKDHHALEDATTRQRALLDGSTAMLGLLGPDGRLVEVNQAALDFCAVERAEVIGRPFWETPWCNQPDDPSAVHAAIEVTRSGKPVRQTFLREDARGTAHWIDYSLHGIFDAQGQIRYFVPEARDVTDAKRAEMALDSLIRSTGAVFGEAFFQRLVSELAAALKVRYVFVGRLDLASSRVTTVALWANGGIAENFSYDLADTPCANVMETGVCTYPDGVQSGFPKDELLVRMGIESYMGVPIIGSGDRRMGILVALHDRPLVQSDAGRGLMELFAVRAATEMERADEAAKVQELNATLEARVAERTERLAQANRELEAFSYSVSHDLRAPLRHIGGFVEMLRDEVEGTLSADGKRYIDIVTASTTRMERLIEDLLTFSRLGRMPVTRQQVSVADLLAEVIRDLAPDIGARRIDWRVGALPCVNADRELLRQVLMNLLDNALKYSQPRDPAIIEIGATVIMGETVLFVRDNGVGFDPAYAGKMFGVFQRLHSDHEFPGTGIGLANIKRIVDRHGGRVWAEGRVGEGACFYFTLPDSGGTDKERV